jgi:hypothetical protein
MTDNKPGKNIGIAQPRSNPSWGSAPHNRVARTDGNFTFQRSNSVMNSYFTSGSFGAPNSQNRKQRVYNEKPVHSFDLFSRRQKKHGVLTTSQQNVEAQVGQMSRLARIKASAIKNSKPQPPPAPVFPVKKGRLQNGHQIADPDDPFGQNGTSWIITSGIKVGDTVSFISTQTNQLFTSTVNSIFANRLINLKDNHGEQGPVTVDVTLHI